MTSTWFIVVTTLLLGFKHASSSCSFRHTSLPTKQPLILADNVYTDVRRFVKSDSSAYVTLAQGRNVTLVCPGAYNYLSGGNTLPKQILSASCVSGTSFSADGRTININQVACYANPAAEVRVVGQGNCGSNTIIIEVGYSIPASPPFFLKLYDVCYDLDVLTPINTRHLVVSGGRGSGSTAYSAYLLPIEPATAYERTAQTTSFTKQLDSESAKKYITTTHYLEAKQIVPKEDFVYSSVQLSAFFYFNTAPLWKTFIASYWSTLESSIRQMTYTQGVLEVYTAVLGTATLPNSNGSHVSMYLYAKNNDLYLPLPALLLKSVANSKDQQVIFIQMLHTEGVSRSVMAESVCAEDVCAQLRWLPWRHVPPAERPQVTCCRADDALLRRRLPRAVAAPAAAPSELLVGD